MRESFILGFFCFVCFLCSLRHRSSCILLSPPLPYVSPMAIYAVKRSEESNDRLQQRFKQQVQKSGLIKLMRERGTHKRKPNRRLVRMRALKREDYRSQNRKKKFYSNM